MGLAALFLAFLGVYNIVLKASFTFLDDGVFWKDAPEGLVAAYVAAGSPAVEAGVRVGDILLGVDDTEVLRADDVEAALAKRAPRTTVRYQLLRADEKRALEVMLRPLPQGNVDLFYYLSLVGFFSLAVGTIVLLRRPVDRNTLHFYAICVLFFLMHSTSFTGRLDALDWTFFWTDHLAILLLPVVFLHFCLSFPERRFPHARAVLVPVAYMPAFALLGASVASQVLFVKTGARGELWRIATVLDRVSPLYLAVLFLLSFLVLLDSYRRTRNLVHRRQMKWLVFGTGAAVVPFLAF